MFSLLSTRSRSQRRTAAAVVVALVCFAANERALADPPTHEFKIVKAGTTDKADCGTVNGKVQCTTACVMHASLQNVSKRDMPELAIALSSGNKDDADENRSVSFFFSSLKRGKGATAVDHVLGAKCNQLSF